MDNLWSYENFKMATAPLEAEQRYSQALRIMEFGVGMNVKANKRKNCQKRSRMSKGGSTEEESVIRKRESRLRPYSAMPKVADAPATQSATPKIRTRPYSALSKMKVVVEEARGESGMEDEEAWRCMRHLACLCNSLALIKLSNNEREQAACLVARALEVVTILPYPESCGEDREVVVRSSLEIQAILINPHLDPHLLTLI